jgi:hypothetical protein
MKAHNFTETGLSSINFDAGNLKPRRDLIADTATFGLLLDLSCTDTVVAGGGADGVVDPENPDGLLPNIRVFDGSTTPIVEISAAELRQMVMRIDGGQAAPGVRLAADGVQVVNLRRQYYVPFVNPRTYNPVETYLRVRDPKNFYLEPEWAGATAALLQAALVVGGTRTHTLTNLKLDVTQIHDRATFAKLLPLYVPRIRRYSFGPVGTQPDFAIQLKITADAIRSMMLRSVDANVTTENIINKVTLRDDNDLIRENLLVRTIHEKELRKYAALEDRAGVAMAYYGSDFADDGRLGTLLKPFQHPNLRYVLDTTGSATRNVRVVTVEYERAPGLVAASSSINPKLLD